MKSCEFLLVVLIVILVKIDTCVTAAKVCPEKALPIDTPEGMLCICTQGHFGKNCQYRALNLKDDKNDTKQECRWYQCIVDFSVNQWFKVKTFFKTFYKDFEKLSFVAGVIVGAIASVILAALSYAVVRLCILGKKTRKRRSERHVTFANVETESASSGSIAIQIEPDLLSSEKPDDSADSQPQDTRIEICEEEIPETVHDSGSVSMLFDLVEIGS